MNAQRTKVVRFVDLFFFIVLMQTVILQVKTTFLSVTKHETLDDKSLLTVMRELESLGQQ